MGRLIGRDGNPVRHIKNGAVRVAGGGAAGAGPATDPHRDTWLRGPSVPARRKVYQRGPPGVTPAWLPLLLGSSGWQGQALLCKYILILAALP